VPVCIWHWLHGLPGRSRRTGGPDLQAALRRQAATAGKLATDIQLRRMRELIQPVAIRARMAGIHQTGQAGAFPSPRRLTAPGRLLRRPAVGDGAP